MTIWKRTPSLERINQLSGSSMVGHLGIEFTEVGAESLSARMPVDQRTQQLLGLLHGGASATLAETLGSIAGLFTVDPQVNYVVGLEINVNHIRSARDGFVLGTASPLHLGRTTQVWQIRITDEGGALTAISRLTLAVREYREGERPAWLASEMSEPEEPAH